MVPPEPKEIVPPLPSTIVFVPENLTKPTKLCALYTVEPSVTVVPVPPPAVSSIVDQYTYHILEAANPPDEVGAFWFQLVAPLPITPPDNNPVAKAYSTFELLGALGALACKVL